MITHPPPTSSAILPNYFSRKKKSEDLKNKENHFNIGIFAIPETNYSKKGRLKINEYNVFEFIRKKKEKGGSMLGIHVGLEPFLLKNAMKHLSS